MAKNNSNREKTIKTTLRAIPGDIWNIDSVSLYSLYDNIAVMPDGFILDEYRDYFENLLEEIRLEERFYYSPSLFAENYYGTADLDFLVLYFAGMKSLHEFNTPSVRVLPTTALVDINKLVAKERLNVRRSKDNPTVYDRVDPISQAAKGYRDGGIETDAQTTTVQRSIAGRLGTSSQLVRIRLLEVPTVYKK
jgi:hypothetical protein